tara:strand:+ start:2628 stop:3992 length:1365 start_codon:yes stop_codon:yes gene_type:complete
MIQKLKIFILFSIISLVLCEQANWVSKRPVNRAYYIGIGMVKKATSENYVQSAKNNALNDLASEISINISSELVDVMIEQSGMSEEQSRSEIQALTKAELEEYELIDTWENDYEYWVYYRLSKEVYKANLELKRQNAISLSLDLFEKAKEKEVNWNTQGSTINSAIEYYIQALKPIESYYGDPLEVSYNGDKIFLQNEIFSSLQWILSKIKLKAKNPKIDVKVGNTLVNELQVSASFTDNGKEVIVTNLPIQFSFIKGDGELVKTRKTNSKGFVNGQIISISPNQKIQMIRASLDLTNYFSEDNASDYLLNTLRNINVPSSKFIVNVIGPKVYLESNEYNLGNLLDVKVLEPKIKSYLTQKGYSFTDDITEADAMIVINSESRQGSEMYGQYVSFVDASISVTDMETGEEIYKNAVQNKKGIQLSYEKAGLKGYQLISKEIENKIVSEILEAMK